MSTRSSLVFSFLDRYAGLLISIFSSMIIARLLTPAEIGVYSVTMVMLTFLATIRDMGAGTYLIQEKNLTTERIRAVWAVQLGLGLGLAVLVAAASYPAAVFYKEPRMKDIMLVISLNYALNPFGSLTYAWLMREMRFKSIALMRFASAMAGAMASVWFAWNGYGPISLAFGACLATIANVLLAQYFRPKHFPWMPGVQQIKTVLAFGSKLMSGSIFGTLAGSAPELLLGKLQNLTSAGLYSRASGLVQMFNRLVVDAVSAVCLPWFSKKSREDGGFSEPFLMATSYVTAIGWTFCVVIVSLAHPVIRILYGNQWDDSVNMTRLLAVAMAVSVPASLCNIALLASGGVNKITKLTIFNACQTVMFVVIGAFNGFLLLGILMVVASTVSAVTTLTITIKHIKIPIKSFLATLCKSAAVAVFSSIGPIAVISFFGLRPEASFLALSVGAPLCLLGAVAGIVTTRHPLRSELNTIYVKVTAFLK